MSSIDKELEIISESEYVFYIVCRIEDIFFLSDSFLDDEISLSESESFEFSFE